MDNFVHKWQSARGWLIPGVRNHEEEIIVAQLNEKAEFFKKFVDKRDPNAFAVRVMEDKFHGVVFSSRMQVENTPVPFLIILDDSAFGMIRVLLAPKAEKEENKQALLELLNKYNSRYKSFKFYLDGQNSLIMDLSLVFRDKNVDGNMIYGLLQMISEELAVIYKEIMHRIWA